MPVVAVGSTNPTKINATKLAFEKVFPDEKWEVIGVKVSSGIPDQPIGHSQTIQGAKNRAQRAMDEAKADFGVGLEGGMQEIDGNWFETGWAVVRNKKSEVGIGSSFHMQVPQKLLRHIKEGKELGIATDIEFNLTDSGKKQGFFGLMTNGHADRTQSYSQGVISALTHFLHPELY